MRLYATQALAVALWIVGHGQAAAQDLEPRRWTPLPTGLNVVGFGYGASTGDLLFDPVLLVEDAEVDLHILGASYVRTFDLAGRSARVDLLVPWVDARWKGLLDSVPTTVTRDGFADPRLRLSVNLVGAPALARSEFAGFMKSKPVNTVVGAALSFTVPVGDYLEDKLLNLGQNRYVIRPQVGVVHTRGRWSYELTGSAFFFTDNDEFWNGNEREQDPIYALQTHLVRVFRPGLWASLSAGYGQGGESQINDVAKDDERSDFLAALSIGFPTASNQGVKLAYILARTREDIGADLDTLAVAWNVRF
jgi:hypothetical protein